MQSFETKCTSCDGSGPFGKDSKKRNGLKSNCRKCLADKQAAYRSANPDVWKNWAAKNGDRLKAKDAARYAADPAAEKARVLAYQRKNPDKAKGWVRKTLYGISPERWQVLFDTQQGKCAICSALLTSGRTGMQLDHDHASGRVRGFLCHLCNMMLGDFRDNPVLLDAAVCYLARGIIQLPKQVRPHGLRSGTRSCNLWYSYGISSTGFDWLLSRQHNGCGICLNSLLLGHGTITPWERGPFGAFCAVPVILA